MNWLRSIAEANPEYQVLVPKIDMIEASYESNPELCIDCAKAIIEDCCKTVLNDRGVLFTSNDKVQDLTSKTFTEVIVPQFEPSDRNAIDRIKSGHGQLISGVVELRNTHGFASHGHDVSRLPIPVALARLTAGVSDSLCGFFVHVHKQHMDIRTRVRLQYSDHRDFNEYYDEIWGPIEFGQYTILPSEVLFECDQISYRAELQAWLESKTEETE